MAGASPIRRGQLPRSNETHLALLLLFPAAATAAAADMSAESARFSEVSSVTIDGHLNEPSWLAAQPVTTFFETYPRSVAEPTVRTEARFLYDEDYIYVGVTAHEPLPSSIRSGLVRRDNITIDHDYIEILIDPLNTHRSAFAFATNPSGSYNDGQFNEDDDIVDMRPDFDFDVGASINEHDWQAEIRIPLSTFRYRTGKDQSWSFAIIRNRPRVDRAKIQSTPEPRQATCTLCFAARAHGISIEKSAPPLYVTPQITYAHGNTDHEIRGSLDAKWLPRSDTAVDLTLWPDFSQVEADDLQLTANAQFTLAVKEKRPFFLEGVDLFSMPIAAVYTRSIAEPQAGMRITHRNDAYDYSALVLRDQSGGPILEPGALSSSVVPHPFDSTAMIGRYRQAIGGLTWGVLASARTNSVARGGENYVYGIDGVWAPTTSDRITAQALLSSTTNPDRTDLVSTWDGRHFDGSAYSVMWQHASDKWYATLADSAYSSGFRVWNGFVPQVDVSTHTASTGLYLYPDGRFISRWSPGFAYIAVRELGGEEISAELYPSLSVTLPYATELTVSWSPKAKNTSLAGARTYDYWSLTLTTSPTVWMPGVTVTATVGEGIDFRSGDVNKATSILASVPLRLLGRLELITSLGYQAHDAHRGGNRLFTEHDTRLDALWHFSSKLYAQALYQDSRFESVAAANGMLPASSSRDKILSALLSYQANWQTRYFVGVRRNRSASQGPATDSNDTEVFAKFSYVLSQWK